MKCLVVIVRDVFLWGNIGGSGTVLIDELNTES